MNGCTCGLYARHTITDVMLRDHIKGRVTGAILAWGDLEVHHDGFRAQFARVIAVCESASTNVTRDVADHYGVPLLPLADLEQHAFREGAPLPASVIPPAPDPPGRPATIRSSDA